MKISHMAPELRFQILRHFDIDTRINQLLAPCSINGRMRDPLVYRLQAIPDLDKLLFVYENGIIKKLTKGGKIHPNLDVLAPTVYTTSRGTVVREHPIYHYELGSRKYSDITFRDYLPRVRPGYSNKKKRLLCYSLAREIRDVLERLKGLTSGIDEFDHRIRKIVYDFIIGIHIYTRKTYGLMILEEKQQLALREMKEAQVKIRRTVQILILPSMMRGVRTRNARMRWNLLKEKKESEKQANVAKKESEKQAKVAKKESEKQAKVAQKESEKQAKVAKKESEKQAKVAQKESQKQAKLAAKESQKQAKLAQKESQKQAKLAAMYFAQFRKIAKW